MIRPPISSALWQAFTFDTTNVETQIANVSALSNELQLTLSMYDAGRSSRKNQYLARTGRGRWT